LPQFCVGDQREVAINPTIGVISRCQIEANCAHNFRFDGKKGNIVPKCGERIREIEAEQKVLLGIQKAAQFFRLNDFRFWKRIEKMAMAELPKFNGGVPGVSRENFGASVENCDNWQRRRKIERESGGFRGKGKRHLFAIAINGERGKLKMRPIGGEKKNGRRMGFQKREGVAVVEKRDGLDHP
jgi:hypothetical protein